MWSSRWTCDGSQSTLVSETYGNMLYGLSMTIPYGARLGYYQDWKGRYNVVKSDFLAININPAVTYQLRDRLAFGMGLSIQYVNFSAETVIASSAVVWVRPLAQIVQAGSPSVDSYVNLKGYDFSGGFNMEVLFQAVPALTLRLAYRSVIEQDIKSTADFSQSEPLGLLLTGSSLLIDTKFNATIKLPHQVSSGVNFKVNDKWDLLGDVVWTGWNCVEVDFRNPNLPSSKSSYNWRLSLVANRKLNDTWKLRTFFSYDRTPVCRDELSTVGTPDEDPITVDLGLFHELHRHTKIELEYTYIFVKKSQNSHC